MMVHTALSGNLTVKQHTECEPPSRKVSSKSHDQLKKVVPAKWVASKTMRIYQKVNYAEENNQPNLNYLRRN